MTKLYNLNMYKIIDPNVFGKPIQSKYIYT